MKRYVITKDDGVFYDHGIAQTHRVDSIDGETRTWIASGSSREEAAMKAAAKIAPSDQRVINLNARLKDLKAVVMAKIAAEILEASE